MRGNYSSRLQEKERERERETKKRRATLKTRNRKREEWTLPANKQKNFKKSQKERKKEKERKGSQRCVRSTKLCGEITRFQGTAACFCGGRDKSNCPGGGKIQAVAHSGILSVVINCDTPVPWNKTRDVTKRVTGGVQPRPQKPCARPRTARFREQNHRRSSFNFYHVARVASISLVLKIWSPAVSEHTNGPTSRWNLFRLSFRWAYCQLVCIVEFSCV